MSAVTLEWPNRGHVFDLAVLLCRCEGIFEIFGTEAVDCCDALVVAEWWCVVRRAVVAEALVVVWRWYGGYAGGWVDSSTCVRVGEGGEQRE